MPSTIYLVRHAESVHNVTKDFNIRDPDLTDLGLTQASALAASFPALSSAAVVLTSPMTRAIQTTLAAFGAIIEDGVELVLEPDLQERSDLPCDTGSDLATLGERFGHLGVAFQRSLDDHWYLKEGPYAADDEAVAARARTVRRTLQELANRLAEGGLAETKRDIVVVTHGVFMKFLVEDSTIDLPKAGWKAYTVEAEGAEPALIPVE
jgi:broad specificity phosphatase PhoE